MKRGFGLDSGIIEMIWYAVLIRLDVNRIFKQLTLSAYSWGTDRELKIDAGHGKPSNSASISL